MKEGQGQGQNQTKLLVALGALVGLCVVSLLCVVVLGGYFFVAQDGENAQTAPRAGEQGTELEPGEPQGTAVVRAGRNELVLLGAEPPTLDPGLAGDSTSSGYIVEIFSGLVTLDKDLEVAPDIAESWDVSEDGLVYTFNLRDGVTFANGKPVTANDFKFSMERVCDPATQSPVADTYLGDIVGCREKLRGQASEISGVRVVDQKTLEIQIDQPKVYFVAKLTYPTAFVVDRKTIEEEGRLWAAQKPNGTGAFTLEEYSFGEKLVLVPNDRYYGNPKPSIDRATYILSGGSGMTLYETGEIDISGIGAADIDRVLDPSSPLNADLQFVEDLSIGYVGLNAGEPPFDDPLVRQAFNYAVDKETIIEVIGRGITDPAYSVLPPGLPGYNENLQGLRFDAEKAKELLAQSSYGSAEGLPDITLHVSGAGGTPTEYVEAITEMWKQNLGVQVNIEQTEWATFLSDISRKPNPYQAFNVGWIADYPDPQNFLDILFHCESVDNKTGYCNEQVDALLEQARIEKDQTRRFELYSQAEQLVINDAAWVPLWYSKGYVLVKPWVENYYFPGTIVPRLKYVNINQ
ncbi:MAG: peptide ABC transporter substrate-binding protein [Ardenticatenaceae bacterium]